MLCIKGMVAAAILAFAVWHQPSLAQSPAPPPRRVIIPFLANATRPADLEFEGAECERNPAGNRMECTFQQVFLTTSAIVPDTCLVTTNRYARTFDLSNATPPDRWVSRQGPDGVCGIVDVVTLHDGGDSTWTMEMRKVATKKDAAATCGTLETGPEILSWQNIRRPLPCKFVQPGGLAW
jgi:hypothetical protein